jgi:hypothetical protein
MKGFSLDSVLKKGLIFEINVSPFGHTTAREEQLKDQILPQQRET